MKLWTIGLAALALSAAATPAAAAPLLGDSISCVASGFTCSSGSAVVGATTEFTGGIGFPTPLLTFDFSSDQLTIGNPESVDWGTTFNVSYAFQDLNKAFDSVTLVSNDGFINLSQANFTVAEGVLDFASPTFFSAAHGAKLTLRLTTADPAAPVPEAANWAMMTFGVGAIGIALRRRGAALRIA